MSEENDFIEVQFPRSIEQADRLMDFVVQKSNILFKAQSNSTRFYYLVPEAGVEFDRVLYSVSNLIDLSPLALQCWIEHAFATGIKYAVVLVDPARLASIPIKPKKIKKSVALFMQ
jgi:hypothetical protein